MVSVTLIGALASLLLVAGLSFSSSQLNLQARSQAWAAEIPIAEAGIEEAIAHLNRNPGNLASQGWANSGGEFVKQRTFGDGYFHASISTTHPPSVVSIGYVQIPSRTNFSHRTVMVTIKGGTPGYAILAKENIEMNGNACIDSFNSNDPNSSSSGRYDPAKRRDNAHVSSLSSATPAIQTGNGVIYGSVATGPNGTATGNVGDVAWISNPANHGKIQPGHFRDDLNMAIPDVPIPFASGFSVPGKGVVDGIQYDYVLKDGNYRLSSCKLSGSDKMIITGNACLYVEGDFTSNGDIIIKPSGNFKLYIRGSQAKFAGNGIVNGTQRADKCAIHGLPTLTDMDWVGGSSFIGTIYAPQADFKAAGNSEIHGSIVARAFRCTGTMDIHYDEALGIPGAGLYQITSWEEL